MRFIVLGAGAIGGVVGARLAQGGHDVRLVARAAHAQAIRANGLRLQAPSGGSVLDLEVVEAVADLDIQPEDIVLLSVKSQDSAAALDALAAVAPPGMALVCMQNGVANEREAARRFEAVYGMTVMLPATHLEPGVVRAESEPVTGIMDVGRFPDGVDETAVRVAAAFEASTFVSEPRPDIMAWKYRKLIKNLGNALQVLIGVDGARDEVLTAARAEADVVLAAAGIDVVTDEQDRERRGNLIRIQPVDGQARAGGSTWQSVQRGMRSVETDYLNGEIALLGNLHGVPTPVNALIQRLMRSVMAGDLAAGSLDEAAIVERLGQAGQR